MRRCLGHIYTPSIVNPGHRRHLLHASPTVCITTRLEVPLEQLINAAQPTDRYLEVLTYLCFTHPDNVALLDEGPVLGLDPMVYLG